MSDSYSFLEHSDFNIIIEASAGTGKTYIITEIISQFIENKISIRELAILTFTEKAATELQDRIRAKLEKVNSDEAKKAIEELGSSQIGTIHQFCRNLVRKYSFELNLSEDFIELEDERENLKEFFDIFWRRIEKDDSIELINLFDKIKYEDFENFCSEIYVKAENKIIKIPEKVSIKEIDSVCNKIKNEFSKFETSSKKINKTEENILEINSNVHLNSIEYESLLKEKKVLTKEKTLTGNIKKEMEPFVNVIELEKNILKFYDLISEFNSYPDLKVLLDYSNLFIKEYSEYKILKNSVSKDDLILFARKLVKQEKIRKSIRESFKYILVDECQDTNRVQIELITNIFKNETKGLIFVGDTKQSIYRFRNADLDSYREGVESLLNKKKIMLNTSYRSSKELIDFHNHLFSTFQSFEYKKIEACEERKNTSLKIPSTILVGVEFKDDKYQQKEIDEELKSDEKKIKIIEEIITIIEKLVHNSRYKILDKLTSEYREIEYSDIGILGYSNSSLRNLIEILSKFKIPANLYKADNFYEDRIIISLIYLLQVIENQLDSDSLFKVLSSDLFLISDEDLIKLEELNEINYMFFTSLAPIEKIFQSLRIAHNQRYHHSIGTTLMNILMENNILEILSLGYNGKRILTNIYHLIDLLNMAQIEGNKTFGNVGQLFVSKLKEKNSQEIKLESDKKNKLYSSIQCMTMHASKGLEFPVCILFDMLSTGSTNKKYYFISKTKVEDEVELDFKLNDIITKKYKNHLKIENEKEQEEKERLLYVSLTRARDFLILPIYENSTSKKNTLINFLNLGLTTEYLTELIEKNIVSIQVDKTQKNNSELKVPNLEKIQSKNFIQIENEPYRFHKLKGYNIQSFSSLSKKDANKNLIIDKANSIDDINSENKEIKKKYSSVNEASSFGLLCHKILEVFPLEKLNSDLEIKKELTKLVKENYTYFNLTNNINYGEEDAFDFCYSALTKEYAMDKEKKVFSKVSDWKYFKRERNFYYNLESPEIDLLLGIGDGLFYFDEKYYIMDWKTNFSPENNYSEEELLKIVETSYKEQYLIYSLNLLSNFSKLNTEDEWNKKFGGMLFIFLRETRTRLGSILIKPTYHDLMDFKNRYLYAK